MAEFSFGLRRLAATLVGVVRRTIFSLAAIASLYAGIHFSFLADKPNDSLTGIWLGFGIIMMTLAWPELVKSVNFMGNSIELRELKSEVKKLNKIMDLYWIELKRENIKSRYEHGLNIEIDTNASFLSIDNVLDSQLKHTQELSGVISSRLDKIWPEILNFLRAYRIDTAEIEKIPYYENPLFNPEWETINLGIPNSFTYLRQLFTQLTLKHYEYVYDSGNMLSAEEMERFETLKKRLVTYAGSVIVD